jgi:hypothetical protein
MVGLDPTIHTARSTSGFVDPHLKAEDDGEGPAEWFPSLSSSRVARLGLKRLFQKSCLKFGTI